MYYRDADHFTREVKKAMDKGGKQGVAEVNKKVKLDTKNEQRKRDLAKKISGKSPSMKEDSHQNRLARRMSDEGDRSANDYR